MSWSFLHLRSSKICYKNNLNRCIVTKSGTGTYQYRTCIFFLPTWYLQTPDTAGNHDRIVKLLLNVACVYQGANQARSFDMRDALRDSADRPQVLLLPYHSSFLPYLIFVPTATLFRYGTSISFVDFFYNLIHCILVGK